MPDGLERTAQEREAARLERERRRAQQTYEAPEVDEELHLDDGEDPVELPSGTRRVSWRSRPPERPKPARRQPRVKRTRSRAGRVLAVVALLLGAFVIWFGVELFQPFHGSGHGSVTVTIPPHSSSSNVGDLLERDGVIASSFFFELRATLAGERGQLRSGTYHLKLDMSYGQVLKILTTPPPAVPTTEITIIPGRTRRQISALLKAQGVRGSYFADTRRSPLLDPGRYGAPPGTDSLEGFLFPDTYQLRKPVSLPALIADQLRTFRERFAGVNLAYARRQGLNPYDVLIIGSMVEAEAQTARDRPLIASVIYNRLRLGMPLQIDATTRYATGNYSAPLTQSQLNSPSPYNTRIHKGLTPTPIDNPALPSIEAAAHPAQTDYLYFVVKPCGNGEHVFASNYQQFLLLVRQYYEVRARRGGRSPVHC